MTAGGDGDSTLAGLIGRRAAETPDGIAFQRLSESDRWEPINWQAFEHQVQIVRRGLMRAGLRRGDRLALIAPVSLEWELLHHAALAIGAVVVGLDAHDLPLRLADMVEQADVGAFVIAQARPLEMVGAERLASARFVLQLGPVAEPLSTGCRRLTWDELVDLGAKVDMQAETAAPGPEDMATIIFTSGTTGSPKGIPYSHGQICLAVTAICEAFAFVDSSSRLLCWLPLSNLLQRIVNLAAVRQGAATYLLSDPRRVMDVVGKVAPDVFIGVPRFYEKLYDGLRANIEAQSPLRRRLAQSAWALGRRMSGYRLQQRTPPLALRLAHAAAERFVLRRVRSIMGQRLRVMVTGSAPTPRHLLEEFNAMGWLVLEAYGLSENVVPMAMNRPNDYRLGTVGRPMEANEIVIADDGAIKVRGAGVFHGYLGGSDRNSFDREGFYYTGDFGHFDADGYLQLTGRTGDIIKTSTGRRVAPAGVEAELRRVPGIDQVVLVGARRKCLVALCTTTQSPVHADHRAQLVAALERQVKQLSEHERPCGIALLDRAFSIEHGDLTPNLKIRRSAIEDLYSPVIENLYALIDRRRPDGAGDLIVV